MKADGDSLRERLRRSTADVHRRIDHHPLMKPLLDRSLRIDQYLAVLRAFDHFYGVLTPELEKYLALYGAGYVFADRRPWLRRDLEALDPNAARRFPAPGWRLPAVTGPEELIGLLYVIEGSLLGGQYISRNLRAALGLTPECGAGFFNGLGDETAHRWSAFLAFAEARCALEKEASAIAAARATFAGLERGFDELWVHFGSNAQSAT